MFRLSDVFAVMPNRTGNPFDRIMIAKRYYAAGQLGRLEQGMISLSQMPERFRIYKSEPWINCSLLKMTIDIGPNFHRWLACLFVP